MTTATFEIFANFKSTIQNDTRKLKSTDGVIARFCVGIYSAYRFIRYSRESIAAYRQSHADCAGACTECGCRSELYDSVLLIRGLSISLVSDISSFPIPLFVKKQLKDALAEWDDFAEDCTMAGDMEFRSTIAEIAARL